MQSLEKVNPETDCELKNKQKKKELFSKTESDQLYSIRIFPQVTHWLIYTSAFH